jgi:hypothetical protein
MAEKVWTPGHARDRIAASNFMASFSMLPATSKAGIARPGRNMRICHYSRSRIQYDAKIHWRIGKTFFSIEIRRTFVEGLSRKDRAQIQWVGHTHVSGQSNIGLTYAQNSISLFG